MGRTTTLQQPQPKQLHSTEDTSRPFSPQNHIIHHQTIKMGGCGNSNCTCSSCSCAPGSCTCNKKAHPLTDRPVGTITRQHHNGTASPRRSSSSSFLKRENMWMDFFDECREA